MGIETEQAFHRTTTAADTLIFTYGTLKQGFSNHSLMQDLIRSRDAVFRGYCRTADKYPLVCGPYRVPFLLNLPGASGSHLVSGELYAVSASGLARLDDIEGTCHGHYERLPIKVELAAATEGEKEEEEEEEEGLKVPAEAYFAHRSYAAEMWKRSGDVGYLVYGEKEARGYIKRKDRPQNLSFLEQIRVFLSSVDN